MIDKDKIVAVAKRIVDILESHEFELDMAEFNSQLLEGGSSVVVQQECGTSFCLVGYLAFLDGYPEKYRISATRSVEVFKHFDYSLELLGLAGYTSENTKVTIQCIWDFLFDSTWPNDKKLAMSRALFIIDNTDAAIDLASMLPTSQISYTEELEHLLEVYKTCRG